MANNIKIRDRVFALDYRLWQDGDPFNKRFLMKAATVVAVHLCEDVSEDEPYCTLVDIHFDHGGLSRSYFAEQLIKIGR